MSSSKNVRAIVALACLGVVGTWSAVVRANPYASQISITGNTVSFDLNEAADSVTVKIGGTTQTLLTTPGFQSFTLPSSTTPFSIQVSKSSGDGWVNGAALQIGTDSSLTTFNSPRGVAVNMNPGQYFGRVYVANSNTGTAIQAQPNPGGPTRASIGRGIYVLNADQSDALGQGDTPLTGDIPALAAGTSTNAPFRLSVGPDNNLYIGDASSAYAGIYRTDPNVASGTGSYMLYGFPGGDTAAADENNHGEIYSKPIVHINGGNVSIYATDAQLGAPNSVNNPTSTPQFNAIRRYDVGSVAVGGAPGGPVPATFIANPSTLGAPPLNDFSGGLTTDLAEGPKDGRLYYMENRAAGTQPGLSVVDPATGTILYDSLSASRAISGNASSPDLLTAVNGVAISPDNKYAAFIDSVTTAGQSTANALVIVPLDATIGGVSGLPDLANMKVITNAWPTALNNGRDLTFDAAGNIYAVSSGQALMRVFSPGGNSSYVTSFDGTNFSFAAAAAVTRIVGDTDGNGVVDLGDLNNVLNNFGFAGTGNVGDDNGDGHVDLGDLNDVLNNFGAHQAAGATAGLVSVPEPATVSLLGVGAVALMGRRRRRA